MNALVGLPRIEPAEAQLRGDLLAALNGVEVDGALLTAALPAQAPRLNWFVCPRDLAFAIGRLGDETLHLNAADGVRAAECLTRAEPLLRAIEWALDVELEPERLTDQPPAGERLWLRIEAGSRDRVYLAVPTDMHVIAAPAAFAPPHLQSDPAGELRDYQTAQRARLSGYAWADRERGLVRIPIDRAMAMIATRGSGAYEPLDPPRTPDLRR